MVTASIMTLKRLVLTSRIVMILGKIGPKFNSVGHKCRNHNGMLCYA